MQSFIQMFEHYSKETYIYKYEHLDYMCKLNKKKQEDFEKMKKEMERRKRCQNKFRRLQKMVLLTGRTGSKQS